MHQNPTIQTYNKYAHVYDEEVVDFWNNFPQIFIDRFASSLPGKKILDLGSGSGRDALLLRNCGLEVVCFDASQVMVAITTKLGFESHLATFSELNFPVASFDGVWAYTSLIHISKDEVRDIIAKIYTLLKPGAAFAIGVIEGDMAGMVERKTMPGTLRYFKHYGKDELRKLVEPFGFTLEYEIDYQPQNSIYLNQLYLRG